MVRSVDQALFLLEEAVASAQGAKHLKEGAQALTPPLKWAGGKRWLGPALRELYAPHRHRLWVEPFVGGLGATLSVMPEEALLGDVNPHLVNFYLHLQRGLRATFPFENAPEAYYTHRARFNELIRRGEIWTEEAALLFYYLNRTGFNGLCRFNRRGEFNVPFGRYKRIHYLLDFTPYKVILSRWRFLWVDFRTLLSQVPEDAFIYADPPYDVDFREYSREGFSWEDQVELAERLALHKGPSVLSNQATPRILKLYAGLGFRIRLLEAPRRIASNGNRTPAIEVLATRGV